MRFFIPMVLQALALKLLMWSLQFSLELTGYTKVFARIDSGQGMREHLILGDIWF